MVAITVIIAILVFALLILVHEAGHFFAAKLSGVRVLEFALGLGPALFKKKVGETEYALRALPFGGQCVMDGELEESSDPRSFNNATLPRRAFILSAGVLMNFLLGYVICLVLLAPVQAVTVPVVDSLMDKFTGGGAAGIQVGDELVRIDNASIFVVGDVTTALARGDDAYYDVVVRRGGQRMTLRDVHIEPQPYEEDGQTVRYYGFRFAKEPVTFLNAFKFAGQDAVNMVRVVVSGLGDLVTGKVGFQDLSGPVGISVAMGQAAKRSMADLWFFTALISINLGVMNLLPLPALDGGRLIFLVYEAIFRRPVNRKVEAYIHGAGLVLLLGLMVAVVFSDVWKLVTNQFHW